MSVEREAANEAYATTPELTQRQSYAIEANYEDDLLPYPCFLYVFKLHL